MKRIILLAIICVFATAMTCSAHFVMMYTPETILDNGGTFAVKSMFTHPFEGDPTMEMEKPTQFFVVNKGAKTDLRGTLTPITWKSAETSATAWESTYTVKGLGDYVFCLEPVPYFEKSEDQYIQQYTKLIVNNGGLPTDWDAKVGLKTEIVPLDKPYALWTGNVFRGVVLSNGNPVPDCDIEVEYMNHALDMELNKFEEKAAVKPPHDVFNTLVIKANANGEFTFGIPKAGWWGFSAISSGPDKKFNGKELEQDAVIWIQARDM